LIVGTPPFEAPDIKAVSQLVLYKDPRPPSEVVEDIPGDVDGVLARALTKARDDRYSSGQAFAEDMAAVREGRRPKLAVVSGEPTQAGGDVTVTSVPPPAKTQARIEKAATGSSEMVVDPIPAVEISAESPSSGRPSRWWIPILILAGTVGYVVAVGPDKVKEQVGPWWTWASDSMGRQVENVQTAVEETRAEQKRISAAQARAESLLQRGRAMEARGQWDRARQEYESSLELFREIKDGGGEASALLARGRLESEVGNWSRARADLDSAASVYRIYSRPAGQSRALILLGNLERDRGNRDRAEAHYGRALSLAEGLEDRGPWLEARLNMAFQDLLAGKWTAARENLDSVRSIAATSELPVLSGRASLLLGVFSYAEGDLKMTATWWEEARRTFRAGGEEGALAEVDLVEGRAALYRGDFESSRKHMEEAERSFRKSKQLPGLAATLENRFRLALTEGDDEQQQAIWKELTTVRARLALPELDMPEQEAESKTSPIVSDARLAHLESLLSAFPRTALAEERLATFSVLVRETGKGS
jgi:tetratricopeptide (TPR) repeat protein